MAARMVLVLQPPSPAPSTSSGMCYKNGGCASDYVAVALTAAVAVTMGVGSALLMLKRRVPEIKAKQMWLLVTQSIGSIVWLTALLMKKNKGPVQKVLQDLQVRATVCPCAVWLEGPFGFGLFMSCYFARAFRLYYVFVGRRLPPVRSLGLVPVLLLPWITLSAILHGVRPFTTTDECKAHWYIWFTIGSMHVFHSLLLAMCTWLIRNIRFEFNEFFELVNGVGICLVFLVIWVTLYIVKTLITQKRALEVIGRFSLIVLADMVVMCLFWIPVARPLWKYIVRGHIIMEGRFHRPNDDSMGRALGVPHSGLLVPQPSRIKLDEPFELLLEHKRFRQSFLEYAESRLAGELLRFWDEVRELSRLSLDNLDRRVYMAVHIIQTYIVNGSPREINISHQMKAEILSTKDLSNSDLFKHAFDEVVNIMRNNLLKDYWESAQFVELKAEVDAEAVYIAQLERMDIRDHPSRQINPLSHSEYSSDNPFDGSQPNSLPPSGHLDPTELELEEIKGKSSILSWGCTPLGGKLA